MAIPLYLGSGIAGRKDFYMHELDQLILELMQERGLLSNLELAGLLKTSRRTVQRHIKKIRESGYIKVVAVPNFVAFGFKAWAMIGIKTDPKQINLVVDKLVKFHFVYCVTHSLGKYDIFIQVAVPDIESLTYFVNYELSNIEGIVGKDVMLFSLPAKYYKYSWPLPEPPILNAMPDRQTGHNKSPYNITELDMKILRTFVDNGQIEAAAIKDKLQVSESIIRRRINYMLENHLVTLEIVPRMEILGGGAWATIGIHTKQKFDNKTIGVLACNPNIHLVTFCIGSYDIIIAVHFKNKELLLEFVSTTLASIEGINLSETFLHGVPVKYHNLKI